jgi:hypothetical protein
MAYISKLEKLKSEKLKKVSDADVYQEANPPEDQHRPFEWRRGFNSVWLPLKNIEIRSNFKINDKPLDIETLFKPKSDKPLWQQIRPEMKTERFIKAVVDDEKFRDKILCAVIDHEDKEITRLEQPSGTIQVNLRIGTPTEGNDQVPSGIYVGRCFRMNYEAGEDYLSFEIYLPEKQLNDLMEYLGSDPSLRVEVGVYLLSFDYEVDAALRDWRHPKYLFIDEYQANAPVMLVSTSSLVGARPDSVDENLDDEVHPQSALLDLSSVTKALGRLTLAIWVLVAIIGYLLIK